MGKEGDGHPVVDDDDDDDDDALVDRYIVMDGACLSHMIAIQKL